MTTHLPLTLLLFAVQLPNESTALSRFESTQIHMGTRVTITLYAPDQDTAERGFQAAFARVADVDRTMSDYDSASEVSRLGQQSPTGEPIAVSDDLWRVLVAAQRLSEHTDGAFDVTIGPVTKLWRRARRQRAMPPANDLAAARAVVGYQALKLDLDRQAISLEKPNMRIDLGGIAKGYAVDAALSALREMGITRALVDAGGDVGTAAPPPGKRHWTIGVRALSRGDEPTHFIHLMNGAVATSGDAWQFVEIDGVRYSHLIDTNTGLGLTERSGVTVVARDCATADSYASAVSVLGGEKGMRLIEATLGVEGMIATIENGQPRLQMTDGFRRLLSQ